jgi:hypothetical protein
VTEKIQKRLKSKQRQQEQIWLLLQACLSFVVSFFSVFCSFLIWVQIIALIFTYARKKSIMLLRWNLLAESSGANRD